MTKYSIIYGDCPWFYRDKAKSGDRGAEFHYPCMKLDELIDMRSYVDSIAEDNSVLFLWTTSPMLRDAMTVMKAWGFKFKIIAFTWIKRTKNNKLFWGMGAVATRANPEFVLMGVRGKGVKRVSASIHSVVEAPLREHSRKPDEVRDRIDKLYGPNYKRIELFAREQFENWDSFGLEVDKFNKVKKVDEKPVFITKEELLEILKGAFKYQNVSDETPMKFIKCD
jgi:N6-adenosine-specific RNA methylase IME4